MSNYIAVSYCPDTSLLQARLNELANAGISGLSDRITLNEDSGTYLMQMFKAVKYSDDGTKSVGVLEVYPNAMLGTFDEDGIMIAPPLMDVINANGVVIEVLASDIKDNQADIWNQIDANGIAAIRTCHPETLVYQDEDGNDVTVSQGLQFHWLA